MSASDALRITPPTALGALPNGWADAIDAHSGRIYYYHKRTRRSTFSAPAPAEADPLENDAPALASEPTSGGGVLGRAISRMTRRKGSLDAPQSVVLSCSRLVQEVKLCVAEERHAALDALYERLAAGEVGAQGAVDELVQLVGSPLVQQASLSVTNMQRGLLPHGWIEYSTAGAGSGQPGQLYYFNVHTKVTTWHKPTGAVPPPPPRLSDDGAEVEGDGAAADAVQVDVAVETHEVAMTGFI